MGNLERSNAERFILIGYGLSITAILLLIILGLIFGNGLLRHYGKDAIVEATKVKLNTKYDSAGYPNYHPTYYYEIDGKNYEYTPPLPTTVYSEEIMTKTLYYNPSNPAKVVAEYETIFRLEHWTILFFFALIITASNMCVAYGKHIKKKLKYLEANGTLLKDEPCTLIPTNRFINDKPLMIAEVEHILESGESVTFNKYIYDYPEDERGTLYADVLFDPKNPKIYMMDLNC